MEVWDAPRIMLAGVRVQVRPAGDTDEVRVTVPVNPFRGETVIVDVALPVAVTEVGLAETPKVAGEVNVNGAVAIWLSEPLSPVIVTV